MVRFWDNGSNTAHHNVVIDVKNLLVHLMAVELEVGDLRPVLDQPPHVLPIGFIDVIVHCF